MYSDLPVCHSPVIPNLCCWSKALAIILCLVATDSDLPQRIVQSLFVRLMLRCRCCSTEACMEWKARVSMQMQYLRALLFDVRLYPARCD